MDDPRHQESALGSERGTKRVLVIDDDEEFRTLCISRIKRLLAELEPKKNDIEVVPADSLEKFEALLATLKADGRERDLIYALVDLKLPTSSRPDAHEEEAKAKAENGQIVLRRLTELNVPTLLMSTERMVDEVFRAGQPRFWPKTEFDDERKIKEVVVQILCARDKAPIIELKFCCDYLRSPVQERGQTRQLPLAFQSPSMRALRNRILGKVAGGTAAVLLLGEPGVECEQLSWLLFREVSRPHDQ